MRIIIMRTTGFLIYAVWMIASQTGTAADKNPVPVTMLPLSEVVFFPIHSAPATAISLNDARVSAEISGLLINLPVKVGDRVSAGDVVATLDCRDSETALKEASAAYQAGLAKYRFDQSQLKKGKRLAKNKNISKDEVDRRTANATIAKAEVSQLLAALEKAETAKERCRITAPFNAIVVERLASIGDFLRRGQAVARLLDTDNIEVTASIQEKDIEALKNGSNFQLSTRNKNYAVRLRTLLPQMDSRLRSFEARFTFVDESAVSGAAGRLTWQTPRPHLPADLVVDRKGLGIFAIEDNAAQFITLKQAIPGLPVPTDLDPSTRLVIEGRFNLNDGDPVSVSNL